MRVKRKKNLYRIGAGLSSLVLLLFILYIIFRVMVVIRPPEIDINELEVMERDSISETSFRIGSDWIRRDSSGLWELYVSGKPLERGINIGKLSSELVRYQEEAFIAFIKEKIPNRYYMHLMKYFIAFFNRNLDEYIPLEYQEEIYGISLSASSEFDFIGSKYQRLLNYHAAHDIGHAVQNMNLVACSSFGVWDEYSSDSSLIIGRNFDFYAGDQFSENKIILFIRPSEGYGFAIITWGGMIGAVSGMNEHGLTVTLNAAKSSIPTQSRTPVSIVARKILQYAKTIDEAFKIAQESEVFVSESFLIGSASDHGVAIIEKSLDTTVLFRQGSNYIIATNHFQDKAFANEALNVKNLANETSSYRFQRTEELLHNYKPLNYNDAAMVLRDRYGLMGKDIGMTNEKAINQLIAHHSVIFKPSQRLMWVSTHPFQLGKYLCYDLKKVFDNSSSPKITDQIIQDTLEIQADTFLLTKDYKEYQFYKLFISSAKKNHFDNVSEDVVKKFIASNPEFYYTYVKAGDYYLEKGEYQESLDYYKLALQKVVSSRAEYEYIEEKIRSIDDTRN